MKPAAWRKLSVVAVEYVTEQRRSGALRPATAKDRRTMLLQWARVVDDPPVAAINRRHVMEFLTHGDVGVSSRRNRFGAMRSFLAWAQDRGLLTRDSMKGMKPPKEPRRLPRALAHDAASAAVAAAPDTRGRLAVILMVQEGLRRAEVAGLERGEIDLTNRTMRVVGKGGHERVLPITKETGEAITAYLRETPGSTGPLLRSEVHPDRGISAGYLGVLVSRWMADAGVKGAAYDGRSAHALRHTAASDMLLNGAHVRDVQAVLGHQSIATTERYLPLLVRGLTDAMEGRRYTE